MSERLSFQSVISSSPKKTSHTKVWHMTWERKLKAVNCESWGQHTASTNWSKYTSVNPSHSRQVKLSKVIKHLPAQIRTISNIQNHSLIDFIWEFYCCVGWIITHKCGLKTSCWHQQRHLSCLISIHNQRPHQIHIYTPFTLDEILIVFVISFNPWSVTTRLDICTDEDVMPILCQHQQ